MINLNPTARIFMTRKQSTTEPVNLSSDMPKHQQVFEVLKQEISSGKYDARRRLPSEAQLVRRLARATPAHRDPRSVRMPPPALNPKGASIGSVSPADRVARVPPGRISRPGVDGGWRKPYNEATLKAGKDKSAGRLGVVTPARRTAEGRMCMRLIQPRAEQ